MSLERKLLLLTVITAVLSATVPAVAEVFHHEPMLPDCCEVDHNYAWFEPIYCDCTEEPPYSTGVFFHFEQLFVNASRAKEAPGGVDFGDNTNGSRYDFGYLYETSGWTASILKINNPGHRLIDTNILRAPIIDGDPFVADDVIVNLGDNAIGDEFETLNAFNVYGAEVNYLWRMEPTHKGYLFEPFLGLRYIRLRDHFDTGVYEIDRFLEGVPGTGPPNSTVLFPAATDLYTLDETTTDNDMFGGQFGMRIGHRNGRWRYSTEIKGITMHNFVTRSRKVQLSGYDGFAVATYDEDGALTAVTTTTEAATAVGETGTDANLFVFGGELRADLAFAITKMFEVSVGGELLVLGDGIARGRFGLDETFVTGGVTLGFAINR